MLPQLKKDADGKLILIIQKRIRSLSGQIGRMVESMPLATRQPVQDQVPERSLSRCAAKSCDLPDLLRRALRGISTGKLPYRSAGCFAAGLG
jgi:hypothetical protein